MTCRVALAQWDIFEASAASLIGVMISRTFETGPSLINYVIQLYALKKRGPFHNKCPFQQTKCVELRVLNGLKRYPRNGQQFGDFDTKVTF